MRRALRVTAAVLLAYLIQATMLPYFKVNGVMLDLMSITLITVGFSRGAYVGFTGGLLAALLMEVATGDLAGLTAVSCISAGAYGAWLAKRVREYTKVGNRRQERLVKQLSPMAAAGLFVGLKDAVYVIYFYLTGVDIVFIHIFKVVISVVETALISLLFMPLLNGFLLRKREETLLFKWIVKRRARGKTGRPAPGKPPHADPPLPRAFVAESDEGEVGETPGEEKPDVAPAIPPEAEEAAVRRGTRPVRRDGKTKREAGAPGGRRRRAEGVYGVDDLPPPDIARRVTPTEGGSDV